MHPPCLPQRGLHARYAPGSAARDGNDRHDRGAGLARLTGPGVSKATTLERLRTKLGVAIEHTVAIGDGANDIEALAWAGRGVAIRHAAEAVREAVGEVTGTIDEDDAATVLASLLRSTAGSLPSNQQSAQPHATR
ncbi:HAD family hydrolase [Promicromonospora iranensis]|uniref:HAD family hydrolase n=1 Tax=Promicromonospora iranensis TaxID=1105144 RepID=UPI0023A9B9D3|nr:HAD hydrolase family protein [Promicromonospora iranensis]